MAVKPPLGAGELRLTVQVEVAPPTTDDGEKLSEPSLAAVIVRVAFAELPPRAPFIVAEVVAATGDVVMENVAVDLPLATFTVGGTEAAELEHVRETEAPLDPAFPERVTVPVLDFPPATEEGETETLLTVWPRAPAASATVEARTRPMRKLSARQNRFKFILGD